MGTFRTLALLLMVCMVCQYCVPSAVSLLAPVSTRGGIALLLVSGESRRGPSQRLLGWPSGLVEDESSDLALLRALAAVRARELDLRYRGRS